MKSIISIQSHFVSGYAGSSSAIFPMQKMGMEVWPIHTAQFSSNSELERGWTEHKLDSDDIRSLMQGLLESGKLNECGAVLSGYQVCEHQYRAVADAVALIKERNPSALYICEPELDSIEEVQGLYDSKTETVAQCLVPTSDVLVLTQYELSNLTGLSIGSLHDAVTACKKMLDMGPKIVLLKHFEASKTDTYNTLLATSNSCHLARLPKITFEKKVHGIGNLLSAIFTACLVRNMSTLESFNHACNAVYGVLQDTKENGKYELQIISGQYEFVEPTYNFDVVKVGSPADFEQQYFENLESV
ncbi:pyridoxal kinase [Agarivorans aestuarii]|uniref:pyridoxal kinase n=1 Tax=Agarivorans aestuarii TaxID=1563703 RepID=UPI001C7FCA24|nr:pyridoxal kinase [Agarivorans aestuarii]